MRIALIHNAILPVGAYGGTERVVWWLAKYLHQMGIQVTLAAAPGTSSPFGPVVTPDFSKPLEAQIPDIDLFHYFFTPGASPRGPYLVTIGGNGRAGEIFFPNTVFVSRNHAERHGASEFVYNGVDPDDYEYREQKEDSLLFLAKASWRVKNVTGAIRIARESGRRLAIVGGKRWLVPRVWHRQRGIEWCGMLGGTEKASRIARARGLLFPVLWDEPFGLAVIECLVSGTPVLASPYGSLPELIDSAAPGTVGKVCHSESEFVAAARELENYAPAACRAHALAHFSAQTMAARYHALYRRILAGESLHRHSPVARESARLHPF